LGKVQRPLEYGGLGIHNLELLGCALRIRWLWAEKTDPSRPWAGLPVQAPRKARALFNIAVDAIVGNGEKIRLWTDRWLNGHNEASPFSIYLYIIVTCLLRIFKNSTCGG
jgi:hypothetical protein